MSAEEPRVRVLIADDQRINRVLLERCLDPLRYEVVEAENGLDALARFEEARPDVVLLDVLMPELDGFETARAMKARLGDDHVPIILVTSLSDEESLRQGMDAGADDFVPKPFNRIVLESKMKAALRTRQAFQALRTKTDELLALNEQVRADQVMAERLMAAVLRSSVLSSPALRHVSRAMDIFNGDLLLACEGPCGRLRVMLGDFSGHGLVAAIGGLPVATGFEQLCEGGASLFEVAQAANGNLREVLPRDRFMAAVLLEIDFRNRTVEVLNAGMPEVLVRSAGGGLRARFEPKHLPLAILEELDRPEDSTKISLEPGDRLYLFSDGVIEAVSPTGAAFGQDRLEALLGERGVADGQVFDRALLALDEFIGEAPAADDVTFLEVFMDASGPAERRGSSRWTKGPGRLDLRLTPALLRSADPLQMVQSMLDAFPPLEGRRADVFAVVAELLNNAVDHGVLGLDSRMKQDLEGFERFYEERAERLAALEDGGVELGLALEQDGDEWRMVLEVTDSGRGFQPSAVQAASSSAPHGRGIAMVKGICESVRYHPPGNRVEVVYQWKDTRRA